MELEVVDVEGEVVQTQWKKASRKVEVVEQAVVARGMKSIQMGEWLSKFETENQGGGERD